MKRVSSNADGSRVLHLDTFSGIAGDMLLAALLDLGLSRAELEGDLEALGLDHRLVVRRVRRGALAAKQVEVRVPASRRGKNRDRHLSAASGEGERPHGRAHAEIVERLERAALEPEVRERALSAFDALARAEAKVHGIPLEAVHFHEVGAVDAIVDITGAAIGLARLGVTQLSASPVALGHGEVECEHGRLPLPAPAVLELLRGVPTVPAHRARETVTPTGAAMLRAWVDEFCEMPAMTIEAVGHGAGGDPGAEGAAELPNVLRAVLGRTEGAQRDRVVCLETNLDDLVPEHFDFLMERLFDAGALDVALQPIQMKKNRPGIALRVLAHPSDKLEVARRLFADSTAIGVRVGELERLVLRREIRHVKTRFGRIAIKAVWDPDGRESVSAELDDCAAAARKHGVSLREVVRVAEEAARA